MSATDPLAAAPGRLDQLLASRFAREGERKLVTILFSDIVDSTKLIETIPTDEAADALRDILDSMRKEVRRFEGTVNKLQGDGLMALFGAPIPQEDHAVRACCAALAMQEAVGRLTSLSPRIRVGIHTGEAHVRAMKNDLSLQYEANGIAVHIAARMEQLANASDVLLTASTLQASRGMIDVEELGLRELKGVSRPMEVYRLRSIRAAVASQQFLGAQQISSFVGRSDELRSLEDALQKAGDGVSPIVGIRGEPGAGKSRLVFEFIQVARGLGIPVVEARATAHSQATPLQPILELYRSFFNITAADTAEIAKAKVESRLSDLGQLSESGVLLDFLGISIDTSSSAGVRRQQHLATLKRFSRAVGNATPGVLIFEDLHWLDDASADFLEAIVEGMSSTKSLLVLNFRPGFDAPWMSSPSYEEIKLTPLAENAVESIVEEIIGSDPSTSSAKKQIVARSQGNPFFAEELIRALVDQGALFGSRGGYRLAEGAAINALPDTVRGVIGFRIDRLTEDQKLFIQAVSAVGQEFDLDIAARAADLDVSKARRFATALLAIAMLQQANVNTYTFKHPLIQEVASGSLVTDRRKAIHSQIARALEERSVGSLDENAALIGHHWSEAKEPMRAAGSYARAAQWLGTRMPSQALQYWERVRQLLEGVPASPPADYMRMLASGQIINLAWREHAEIERLQPVYEQAIGIAKKLSDARAAALITMAYGRALAAAGSADEYLHRVEQAQEFLSETNNPSVSALLVAVQAHAVGLSGFLNRALELNKTALERATEIDENDRRALGFEPRHWLRALRARYLVYVGAFDEAEKLTDSLLDKSLSDADTFHQAIALGIKVDSAALKSEPASALNSADLLMKLAGESATPYLSVLSKHSRGVALLANGEHRAARETISEALEVARSTRAGLEFEALMLANLAEALAEENDQAALGIAREARALAIKRSTRVAEAYAVLSILRSQRIFGIVTSQDLRSRFEALIAETGAAALKARLRG